jgi:hypothetical protein
MYTWFSHHQAKLTPPPPDFKVIIHQILMQVYVLPMLPLSLYQLAYPKRLTSGQGTVTTASLSSSGTASASVATSSSGSTVSGLTTASGNPTSLITPGGSRGARIANSAPIPALVNLVPSSTKLRDLMGSTAPPLLDNGGEMCLSYLLRGGCWSNCRHIDQHIST